MHYIKRLIAKIRSWFKASEPEPVKPVIKHKKHVHLTAKEKSSLYDLWAAGEEPTELARAFDVSMSTVYRVIADYERKSIRRKVKAMREAA